MGIDKYGEKIIKVPHEEYEKVLGTTLAETYDAAQSSINRLDEKHSQWQLNYIRVDIGIEGTVGIANIVTLGASPRVRMWFRRHPIPTPADLAEEKK